MLTQFTTKNIVKGRTYKARYRAKNKYGWGAYSDEALLLVAQAPSKLLTPSFVSSTDTDLIISMDLNVDNGGSSITGYKLQINDGTTADPSIDIAYDGSTPTKTLNQVTHSLTTGKVYKIWIIATNIIGDSTPSNTLTIGLIQKPATPSIPVRVDSSSTETSIAVDWTQVADHTGPAGLIKGYKLYMAVGPSSSFTIVYDGSNNPTITNYVIGNLVTGTLYRFKVTSFNNNGESDASPIMTTYACVAPSQMA